MAVPNTSSGPPSGFPPGPLTSKTGPSRAANSSGNVTTTTCGPALIGIRARKNRTPSPGDWLLYRTGQTQGDRDIYALRMGSDSARVTIAADPGVDEFSPTLSPDGRWVAYVLNTGTNITSIWVRPFPNTADGRWLISDRGSDPMWAHNGRELFFRGERTLMVARVQTDPTFSVLETTALFSLDDYPSTDLRTNYDVSADDQRFLMIRTDVGAELVVVLNFFEDLKERVGN